ncbi:MAG: hypothetical protein KC910_15155 [Candidatus Eremiobacteraeota bacterium]|nr:hypothetical protein [Candidatus Eremiobacteraeota bacterium]
MDKIKRKVAEMRVELVATRDALKRGEQALAQVEAAFETMGARLGDVEHGLAGVQKGLAVVEKGLAETQQGLAETQQGLAEANRGISTNRQNQHDSSRRFDNFLARFDEVTEMLIESDTDHLRRVTAVERSQDQLQSEIAEVKGRLDDLEQKAG